MAKNKYIINLCNLLEFYYFKLYTVEIKRYKISELYVTSAMIQHYELRAHISQTEHVYLLHTLVPFHKITQRL